MKKTFGEKAIEFYLNLKTPDNLPAQIEIQNPYVDPNVKEITRKFYTRFYDDFNNRYFLFGINPGRFGGGITGINFTDPAALRDYCKIENNFGGKRELSSQFIYLMINSFGGAEKFYSKFFISALYPLPILSERKNYNFYDQKEIYDFLKPKILSNIKEQINFGAKEGLAVSLGKKNYFYLNKLNNKIGYFKNIEFLEHPRFIMQYRRKKLDDYINKYLSLLNKIS